MYTNSTLTNKWEFWEKKILYLSSCPSQKILTESEFHAWYYCVFINGIYIEYGSLYDTHVDALLPLLH